jgi:hypothetical protein
MANMRLTNQTLDLRTLGGLFGRADFQVAAAGTAIVTAGTSRQIFADQLNTNTTSGVPGNTQISDATMFGGMLPSGEVLTIWGFQVQVNQLDINNAPVVGTAAVTQNIIDNVRLTLFMQGSEFIIGNIGTMPSGIGGSQLSQNGGRSVAPFRFPSSLPIQIQGNQSFFVKLDVLNNITLDANDNQIEIQVYCPASRGIPVSQLSGA